MAIQFLDSRLSLQLSNSEGTEHLSRTPQLLGDIGLETIAAVGTPNQSNIRVSLWGTIGVSGRSGDAVSIFVQRGGTDQLDTGTIIYSAVVELTGRSNTQLLTFAAGDFPSAQDAASGEIRYTMFAREHNSKSRVILTGPISFNGMAVAGNA